MPFPRRFWFAAVLLVCALFVAAREQAATSAAIELRFPGRDPRVRWDRSGNLHMTLVREIEGKPRLFYARGGPRPQAPTAVSPASDSIEASSESAGSIEVLPDGRLVVVYSVRTGHEWDGEIHAQVSTDNGRTWSKPVTVHDDGKACSHALVSTSVTDSGELLVAWLDSRTGTQGLEFSRSRDGVRFSKNQRLDERTCECCGISILPDPPSAAWVAYRDLQEKDLRDISVLHIDSSDRAGKPVPLSRDGWHLKACPDAGPRLARSKDGTIWAAWFTGATPGIFVASSADRGATFTPRRQLAPVSEAGPPANHPELSVLPDGRLLLLFDAFNSGRRSVFTRTADVRGRLWGAPRLVAADATSARVAVSGQLVALAYTAKSGTETLAIATAGPFREGSALGAVASEANR